MKSSNKLRDQEQPNVLGYDLDRTSLTPIRTRVDTSKTGDYGCDPLGEDEHGVFRWRMVPSGDIVDATERKRRIG